MNAQQETAHSTLLELIETCRDGQEGFRKASECIVDHPELKLLLASFSVQRGKFAKELEDHLRTLGGEVPESGGSVSGQLHRWWMDLQHASTREDNRRILAECERGEDTAKEVYRKALSDLESLPDSVRGLALWQEREIIGVHDTIKALRDASPETFDEILASAYETYHDEEGEMLLSRTPAHRQRSGWLQPLPILALALGAGVLVGLVYYAFELRNERLRLEVDGRPLKRLGRSAQSTLEELRHRTRMGLERVQDRVEEIRAGRRRDRMMRNMRRWFRRFFE